MTIYTPRLTPQQIVNAIFGWTDSAWTPGISFNAGPTSSRPNTPADKTLYFDTSYGHLFQYQTNSWVDLGGAGNEVPTASGSDPTNPNLEDFVNRYDAQLVKQCTNTNPLTWTSMGNNNEGLPTGTTALTGYSVLTLQDTDPSKNLFANLFLILSKDTSKNPPIYTPLLAMDQGLVVKKDVSAGGFLASNQGTLYLGHGLNNPNDHPQIILSDSGIGFPTLDIKKFDDSFADVHVGNAIVSSVIINGVTSDPSPAADGQIWFRSNL